MKNGGILRARIPHSCRLIKNQHFLGDFPPCKNMSGGCAYLSDVDEEDHDDNDRNMMRKLECDDHHFHDDEN